MNKLDVTIGLGRMLGNKRLDLTMRCKDVEGQSGFTLLMKNAVAAGDMATGQRAAHSLKGVSGTIGATDIPHLANAVETAMRAAEPREAIDQALTALDTPLTTLLQALPAWFAAHPPQSTGR